MQDTGCRVWEAACKIGGAGCQMWDVKCRIGDVGCRVRDVRCRMQNRGCRVQGAGCGISVALAGRRAFEHGQQRDLQVCHPIVP